METRRALISVSNKEGVASFARELQALGWEILSTGGTRQELKNGGVSCIPLEQVTGNPEAFDGRMKTISFAVESAILFDRKSQKHVREAQSLGIVPIDLVVCNFYPFQEQLRANPEAPMDEMVELIDIGGPTMVRAAAKNFSSVTVVVNPHDYPLVLDEIRQHGEVSLSTRSCLATRAFAHVSEYDREIEQFFRRSVPLEGLPCAMQDKRTPLRYGENPHQEAFFLPDPEIPVAAAEQGGDPLRFSNWKRWAGKDLSYNNYLDMDGALYALSQIGERDPACVIVKHANPCGAAVADSAEEAFLRAWGGDPLAAFGGIVAINRHVDLPLAETILNEREGKGGKRFLEILMVQGISEEALTFLSSRRKDLIVMANADLSHPFLSGRWDMRRVRGGTLTQSPDLKILEEKDLLVASRRPPSAREVKDLLFAWKICRSCKSNSVVIAKDQALVAAGAGQQDRYRCCRLAVEKGGEGASGSVAASDGFFPFPDGPEVLARAGVTAIIQPGGSKRDRETVDLCDRHGLALAMTGVRCFRH